MKIKALLFIPFISLLLSSCTPSLKTEISQDEWNDNRQYVTLSTGLKMSYVEMGNPNGQPIVLQHGTTDNSRSWSFAAPYFAKEGYHVYIPDLRGQGKSEEMPNHYTTLVYARDLNAFFEAKNINNAVVVGHSLGSFVMQTFWMLYPERVNKCVLVSSIPLLGYQGASLQKVYDTYISPLPEDGHMPDSFMDWWYDCSGEPIEPEIQGQTFDTFISYMKKEAQVLSKKAWSNIFLGMLDTDFNGALPGYSLYSQFDKSKKCLILHGANDTMTVSAYQEELVNLLSNESKTNVTYHEYNNVGHNIQFVTPKQSSTDIIRWLKTGTLS